MVDQNTSLFFRRLLLRGSWAFFLLLCCMQVTAQSESRKGQFNIGVGGGVQLTDIRLTGTIFQTSGKTGFHVDVFGDYYLNNDFRLRLALNYDARAFQANSSFPLADTSGRIGNSYYLYQADYNLNFLTIPLGIVYARGGDKIKVQLQFSLYYSLLLNASLLGGEDFYIAPEDIGSIPGDSDLLPGHNYYAYDQQATGLTYLFGNDTIPFRNYDFGMNFQLGILYQVTPTVGIDVSIGFNYGLTNVFENPNLDSRWSPITRFNLGIAYTLWRR